MNEKGIKSTLDPFISREHHLINYYYANPKGSRKNVNLFFREP